MTGTTTRQAERYFIGLEIPRQIKDEISSQAVRYTADYKIIPAEYWHLTLLFLGNIEAIDSLKVLVSEPLPQAFVPAVKFTHLGAGLSPGQLWVWGLETAVLNRIRGQIIARVEKIGFRGEALSRQNKKFIPHVTVGKKRANGKGLTADTPFKGGFRPESAMIFRSLNSEDGILYEREGRIDII